MIAYFLRELLELLALELQVKDLVQKLVLLALSAKQSHRATFKVIDVRSTDGLIKRWDWEVGDS